MHQVVAVGSSSSTDKAKEFAKALGVPNAQCYGTYEGAFNPLQPDIQLTSELVRDPNVDIIYVATPHSHHYGNVKLALEAGKNVLCEKPFTGALRLA